MNPTLRFISLPSTGQRELMIENESAKTMRFKTKY